MNIDWFPLWLSLRVAGISTALALGVGLWLAWALANRRFRGKEILDAAVTLPLVLPPTVLGYYLLVALGGHSPVGHWYEAAFGHPLVFTFDGLVVASVLFNLPFAIQPVQRAFEAIPADLRHAAACCGLSDLQSLWRIELPLAWAGLVTAAVLTFAHTLGEFGVVLMVGGNLPGVTRTISISIYDQVQALQYDAANRTALLLLAFSFLVLAAVYGLRRRPWSVTPL